MQSMGTRRSDAIDILLVEDNPGDVRLTQEAFKEGRISNDLHVATDGAEALDFLHQRDKFDNAPRPEIVLLDLNMPKVGGLEVLEEIRANPDLQRLPVVILTSSKAEEDIVRSYELQTNAYLIKPVSLTEFLELIRSFKDFWLETVRLPPDPA